MCIRDRQYPDACLGNHDAGPSYDRMMEFLSEAGVRVLQDEAVVIDSRFVLAGRTHFLSAGRESGGGAWNCLKGRRSCL